MYRSLSEVVLVAGQIHESYECHHVFAVAALTRVATAAGVTHASKQLATEK